MFNLLPEQASDIAAQVDWLNGWIMDISLFFTVAIFGTAVYFAVKYRRKGGVDHETPRIEGDNRLEAVWTIVPTIIVVFIALNGFTIYRTMRTPPPDAIDVKVKARMWEWRFEYPNGRQTNGTLVVPVNKAVKLLMKSDDVIHSFFIPSMRVKNDVLPNRYTFVWFRPIKTGVYRAFCTEFCGDYHSSMGAAVRVVSEAEYERWLNDDSEKRLKERLSPVQLGARLYTTQNCVTCHTVDGTRKIGPSFKGLWGKEEELADGTTVKVDENYVRDSILNPVSKVVKGYQPVMPAYLNILSEDDILAIIEFVKSVKEGTQNSAFSSAVQKAVSPPAKQGEEEDAPASPEKRGEKLYTALACNACHTLTGAKLVGPSFKGVYGHEVELTDGRKVVVDDEYIKRSILDPTFEVVKGYPPAMLSFKDRVSEQDIADLTAFIKSLK